MYTILFCSNNQIILLKFILFFLNVGFWAPLDMDMGLSFSSMLWNILPNFSKGKILKEFHSQVISQKFLLCAK